MLWVLPHPHFALQVGRDINLEEATQAAECVALSLLATLKQELGNLDRVHRVLLYTSLTTTFTGVLQIVKLVGFVNCTDNFTDQAKV